MTNKLKFLTATSLVAFLATGCSTAPAPWAKNKNSGSGKGVTHSHNGIVHTHPLPPSGIHHTHRQGGGVGTAVGGYGSATGGRNYSTNAVSVKHRHGGIIHSHPLPPEGIHHSHSGGPIGQAVGGASGGYYSGGTRTSPYPDYSYGGAGQGAGYYDGEFGSRRDSGSRYGDYGGYGSDPYNRDYGSDYGRNSGSRDTGYYDSRDSSSADSGDYSSKYQSSASDWDGGDYYTVQPKDTVFQVMRITGAYWKDIIRLNNLKAPKYEIHPGQRLKLPKERDSK